MKIEPYLFFGGNAEEALAYYAEVLGGTVEEKLRYADSPAPVPPEYMPSGGPHKLMHASLLVQGQRLMLSDGMRGGSGKFLGIALTLQYDTEAEAKRTYETLAREGTVVMPMGSTFFSPCYGVVIDRFGVQWMVMT